MLQNDYIETTSYEERCLKSSKILETFLNKVPVICIFENTITSKYILSRDLSSDYICNLHPNLYLLTQNGTLLVSQNLGKMYENNKGDDGNLYINVLTKLKSS
jgi:hypothetical protein